MTLTLGFSPCPNDCFVFDAIVHRRIDLEGLDFSFRIADVEALNQAAFRHEIARDHAGSVSDSDVRCCSRFETTTRVRAFPR